MILGFRAFGLTLVKVNKKSTIDKVNNWSELSRLVIFHVKSNVMV
jgi:hypothetical protein